MALPEFNMRQLLEAGVHFGHQTARWNPRMGPYIYGSRNGIHILDLTQTVPLLEEASHEAHAPDLPGSGDDPTPIPEVSLQGYADRISEVLDSNPSLSCSSGTAQAARS